MGYDSLALIIACLAIFSIYGLIVKILRRERELRRFAPARSRWWEFLFDDARRFIQYRISQRRKRREGAGNQEVQRLTQAGLESTESREKFYLAKDLCVLATITVCLSSFTLYRESLAGIVSAATISLGYYGPNWWALHRAKERQLRYERELPFFLQAVASGTSIGWDAVRVLDRLADTLGEDELIHPLVRELRRAQWYGTTGSSWSNGLRGLTGRFPNPMLSHTVAALSSALESEVRRHELLEGIARDAHRSYLVRLEGRLAVLPVATLTIGLILLAGFALLLQVPFL